MSFYEFWKNRIFAQNPYVAYDFTENRQFGAKIDRNSVFHGRDPYITNRLYITVPYMSFYRFWENLNFRSKSISVSLRYYQKSPVWGQKLTETPYFIIMSPILQIV
jgi:hypothetical protein